MFYYRIKGIVGNEEVAKELKNRDFFSDDNGRYALISDEIYERSDKHACLFISSIVKQDITFGLICDDNKRIGARINDYLRKFNFDISDVSYEEITFNLLYRMIKDSEHRDYICDADDILDDFGVFPLSGRGFSGVKFAYSEKMIEENGVEDLLNSTGCFMTKQSLVEELDRIASGDKGKVVSGHPVHYLIQTADKEKSNDVVRVLTASLYAHHRLRSKRYTALGFKSEHSFSRNDLDPLYISAEGGAVFIQINYENDRVSNYATGSLQNIELTCRVIKEFANDVLSIIWLPKTNETTKKILYEKLGHTNIVEICDSTTDADGAREYLKLLAKEKETRTDKKLFADIEDGKRYLSSELNEMYDIWYSKKLKSVIFPQYKGIESVKTKIAEATPEGSAYDELMEMIGLDRAKSVINQALDYNKAQKIFADKGLKADRTSMHMVFSGNPGTAKTSVARLFAQIMKDNEVLTQGKLIECGRGDLVGKFVGWTAPTVQRKFKEAEGSVLFIDEAYSLVDDRNGSYGDEAINTIVQEMENHRDDVVVIFAGYPDKMEEFLRKNPGLRSRIAYHVPFDDYNVDELCDIAEMIARKRNLILADDARDKLRDVFTVALKEDDFGNGRYARNVIEKAKMAQASRLVAMDYASLTSDDVRTIVASDIEMPLVKAKKTRIGFVA